eukprot:TRINITY_DN6687_c0_g1_i1.p1 TRINITY_DN6687_c0_g1~~TRINITY_DN6687_c0_g1_i1.p1  ORF type:complete len:729 (+),score=134.35 TRINITY_DN6687_c0_g1_i1:45-2189(+)
MGLRCCCPRDAQRGSAEGSSDSPLREPPRASQDADERQSLLAGVSQGQASVSATADGDWSGDDRGRARKTNKGSKRKRPAAGPAAARPITRSEEQSTQEPHPSDAIPCDGRLSVLSTGSGEVQRTCAAYHQETPQHIPLNSPQLHAIDSVPGPLSPIYSSGATTPSASPSASCRSSSPFQTHRYGPHASVPRALCLSPPDSWSRAGAAQCIEFQVPGPARHSGRRGVPVPVQPSHGMPRQGRGKWIGRNVDSICSDPERGSSGDESSLALPSPPVEQEDFNKRDPYEEDPQARLHSIKKEIYDTECAYLASLMQLCKFYLEPMKLMFDAEGKRSSKSAPQQQQNDQDIFDKFFGSLMLIVGCNTELLKDMRTAIAEYQNTLPTTVRKDRRASPDDTQPLPIPSADFAGVDYGRVFGNFRILRLYSSYITNYDQFLQFLKQRGAAIDDDEVESVEGTKLSNFLAKVQAELEGSRGDVSVDVSLRGYLIRPIQRLMGYSLLLQQVIRYSSPDDVSVPELRRACDEVTAVCTYCNQKKRETDGGLKVAEISEQLGQDLVRPGRYWILDGVVEKVTEDRRGRYRTTQCRVFLFSDILLWVKRGWALQQRRPSCVRMEDVVDIRDEFPRDRAGPGPVRYGSAPVAASPGNSCNKDSAFDPRCTFAIIMPTYTLGLVLESPGQRSIWCEAVRAAQRQWVRRSRRQTRKRSMIGINLNDIE